MAHVFISYAPENYEYAEILLRWLEHNRIPFWIDSDPEQIPTGKDWRNEIDDAIRESFILLAVMTPEAKAFEYVSYEWTFALGVGVRVLPVVFKRVDLPPRLRNLQPLHFTDARQYPWKQLHQILKNAFSEYRFANTNPQTSVSADVGQVAIALNSNDPNQINSAFRTLSQLDDWTARETLVSLMRYPARNVRTAAAMALARSGDARTIPSLLEAMKDSDTAIQNAALRALVEVDPEGVLELILGVLRDDEKRAIWVSSRVDKAIPKHVFLSYSRQDADMMSRLRDDLQDEHIIVWTDEALTTGDASWLSAVQSAIDNAACLIVMLSPHAKKSRWVLEEMNYAQLRNVVVYPVLIRGEEADALPFGWTATQWLDLRTEALYNSGLPKLIRVIQRRLRQI